MNKFEFFILFFSIMILGSIAAPIKIGNFNSEWEFRYSIFPIFMGLTNIFLIIDYYILNRYPKIMQLVSILIILVSITYITINYNKYKPFSVVSKVSSYYPAIVKAVDDLSDKYKLKNGVGDHWESKYITELSKKGNKIYSIWSTSLYLRNFGNNRASYFYTDCNKKDTAYFNYIVPRSLADTNFIYDFFGSDTKRVTIDAYVFYLVPDFYYDRITHAPVKTNRNVFINLK